jgi:hypothetical protein
MSLTFNVKNFNGKTFNGKTFNGKKTFCKICFDAGKEPKDYTSHFLKDRPGPKGNVICPTLLNTNCRYCKAKGHFKSHCPKLLNRKPRSQYGWQPTNKKQKAPVKQSFKGQFAVMYENIPEPSVPEANVPTVAEPVALQGFWSTKTSKPSKPSKLSKLSKPSKPSKPSKLSKPNKVTLPKALPKTMPKALPKALPPSNPELIRLTAELADVKLELEAELAGSTCWADEGDVEDLEEEIAVLELAIANCK